MGAGIAGLAMARALSNKGYIVSVVERSAYAVGASVRNFGMIWPIGQPSGDLFDCAVRSREVWKQFAGEAGVFHDSVGSLHLAYHADEALVLGELHELYGKERKLNMLSPDKILECSGAVVKNGLVNGLFSPLEMIVDPREAIRELPSWLELKHNVTFIWNEMVLAISEQTVYTANEELEADLIVVCTGADMELLFPEVFLDHPVTKCKLQMMRMAAQPSEWRIGPALCGGLSLIHYPGFRVADSLEVLKRRYMQEFEEYLNMGIHVMVSQNGKGELTIGDSHEYGNTFEPFDKESINRMILDYLSRFASFRDNTVIETWHGFYSKLTNGEAFLFSNPQAGIYVFNGLGGAGMTLSFGLAERLVKQIH